MDKTLQEKFRTELVESYLKAAWEALANYNFYGKRYKTVEGQIDEMSKKMAECNDKISEISNLPDYHSTENREKVKLLKKDSEDYGKRIKSVAEMAKKIFDEAVAWQEKGSRLLEMAENFKEFSVKTPEQIEADKIKK